MALQYTYHHSCAHIGVGPIIHTHLDPPRFTQPHKVSPIQTPPYFENSKIALDLPSTCPFCSTENRLNLEFDLSLSNYSSYSHLGALAMLSSAVKGLFPRVWRVVRICSLNDVKEWDWSPMLCFVSRSPGGGDVGSGLRHMAWFERPIGQAETLRMSDGRGGSSVSSVVSTRWRQRGKEQKDMGMGRFGGLMQRLREREYGMMVEGEKVVEAGARGRPKFSNGVFQDDAMSLWSS